MKEKIVLFPVDRASVAMVRHAANLLEEEVIPLLPEALKVLAGMDISVMDGGAEAKIVFSIEYEKMIDISSKVFLCNSDSVEDNETYIRLIDYAKTMNKEVIISEALERRLNIENESRKEEIKTSYKIEELVDIEVPIISIFGYGANCNQLDVELAMRSYFLEQGYKITQIGNSEASELFDFTSIPEFLFDINIDVEEKIIRFNRFVYNLSKKQKSDIIILGVPEGIMKYNNQILNGLGIIPFIMQSAISSDVAVVNLYQNSYPKEYFDEVKKYCKYRFGIQPKYFNIANTQIMKNIDDNTVLDYLFLDSIFVISNIDKSAFDENTMIFNSLDALGSKKVFKEIEKELSSNVCRI